VSHIICSFVNHFIVALVHTAIYTTQTSTHQLEGDSYEKYSRNKNRNVF